MTANKFDNMELVMRDYIKTTLTFLGVWVSAWFGLGYSPNSAMEYWLEKIFVLVIAPAFMTVVRWGYERWKAKTAKRLPKRRKRTL